MLKVFLGCVVSVVVLLSSAYVPLGSPRAYAVSATVIMTQIQAGGVGAASQEFIVIYNNSANEVDITGWCLTNKNDATIACFNTPGYGRALILPTYAHAVAVSNTLPLTTGKATAIYAPISQSSGSITGSSDTISLIDQAGHVIDRQAWTTAIAAGMQFERRGMSNPITYEDTDTSADWAITLTGPFPSDEAEVDMSILDLCPNIDGVQTILPPAKQFGTEGECIDQVIVQLDLTEALPNAVGADDGQEFIELYNPNDKAVLLADYQLLIGLQLDDTYDFPEGAIIQPHEYLSFSNSQIPFTLLNSSSLVLLILKDGTVVSAMPVYTSPKDGESWAVINDVWLYTSRPTPGSANTVIDSSVLVVKTDMTVQPCATNQYRSPDTNRCRLLASTAPTVTPCKEGQYRSEETNRCRTVAMVTQTVTPCNADQERNLDTGRCRNIVATSEPAPCKEGQERNPDTNRCRTITKMPSADYGVLGAETKSGGNWYVWAAVGGVLLLAVGYAVWEWHDEIGKFFRRYYHKALRFARIHK